MAVIKGKKKTEVVEEKPVKATRSKKQEVVEEEIVLTATNPADYYLYRVKLDSKKYEGRDAEQVEALTFGALGAVKKITIERLDNEE